VTSVCSHDPKEARVPVQILGMVAAQEVSETRGSMTERTIDPWFLARFAQAQEAGGFDRVLIGYGATQPDGFAIAAHVLHNTSELKVLIAHRPGFVAPSLVARKLITLDHLAGGGRVAIHHITGGDEADQRREGDRLDHDERYRRTAEFMTVLRAVLTSEQPVDYDGEFYSFAGAHSQVRPATPIPLYFGGASDAAVAVGAAHADVYMLWGEPRAKIAERIARVRAAAAPLGRELSFSLSVRPILADTESAAWARAERIEAATAERIAANGSTGRRMNASSVGGKRLREQGAESLVHDERLWYGVARLTGAAYNATALVGTPAQVADALLRYHELGVDTFLIRGFDPYDDAVDYGRELIGLVRRGAAESAPLAAAGVAAVGGVADGGAP
jgi:alkanesulfonate monooxygenase